MVSILSLYLTFTLCGLPLCGPGRKKSPMNICLSIHIDYRAYQLVLRGILGTCAHLASPDHFMGEGVGYVHFDGK